MIHSIFSLPTTSICTHPAPGLGILVVSWPVPSAQFTAFSEVPIQPIIWYNRKVQHLPLELCHPLGTDSNLWGRDTQPRCYFTFYSTRIPHTQAKPVFRIIIVVSREDTDFLTEPFLLTCESANDQSRKCKSNRSFSKTRQDL